jgi:hypothetical protein
MAVDNGGSQGPDTPRNRLTIIVDGANVVGSRPDGWWHDRAGAAVRLYDDLLRLAARSATDVSDAFVTSGAGGPGEGVVDQGGGPGGAMSLDDAWQAAEVVLVLEGAARAAMPQITARARAAEGGHSPAQSDSREGEGGSGGEGGGTGGPADLVRVVYAPGSGDDEIVRLVRSLPGRRVVVTADRELRRRCEAAGADVAGPSWLYALM